MRTALQKIKMTRLALLLVMFHLPLTALISMQVGAHEFEHRANTHHATAHTMLGCRLACTAFVFMASPVADLSQCLKTSFEKKRLSYENAYKKMALSKPSIRGPPEN